MKKNVNLLLLCFFTSALIYVSHYYNWELARWFRVTIALPIIYAGFHYRRFIATAVAIVLILAQGPLYMIQFGKHFMVGVEYFTVALIISVLSVVYGHILRKGKENAATLKQTGDLIRSMRKSVDEEILLETLEKFFAETGASKEVATYLFGEDGKLRLRNAPGAEPLPEGHLFYAVAESGQFMASANPAQDPRLTYYGPEEKRGSLINLAAFPLEYGGRARGVISIANSTGEHFEKDKIPYLSAIKQSVENTLSLGEKLRDRIRHEVRRQSIRDTFSSYLSRTVAEEILKNPDRLELGGEVRDVTILFTEVTNFGELTRSAPPEELFVRLNEFFSIAIDTIFEFNGTLDKFIGDNIMAFWGAPLDTPDSERKAVDCARKLYEKLAALNAAWEQSGAQPFHVCIGINSGSVVAGNIGSIRRMEYTIIGDTVNTAARIKSLSKSKGIPILMGETTYLKIRDKVKIEQKFETLVKGKTGAITVYQIAI